MSANTIWTKSFILACLGCFMLFANFYMLLSALPLAIQRSMDGGARDMSLVVSIYVLGIVVLRPFSGVLADKFGKRMVAIATMIGFSICSFAYLGVQAIFPLLLIRFVHGLFHSAATTAHAAMAIDMLPAEKKGEGIGYYGLAMSLSMVLGPALGIYLLHVYDDRLLLLVSGIFAVIGYLFTVFIPKPLARQLPLANLNQERGKLGLSRFLAYSAIPVSIAALLFSFCYSSLISFMAVYTKELGVPNAGMYFFIAFALSILLSRPLVGKLLDRRGPSYLMYPALFIFACGILFLSFASGSIAIICAGLLLGLAYGAIFPCLQTITVRLSPPHRTGAATATFFLFYDSGFGTGAFALASLAAVVGYSKMYMLVSGLVLVTMLLYYLLYDRKQMTKG